MDMKPLGWVCGILLGMGVGISGALADPIPPSAQDPNPAGESACGTPSRDRIPADPLEAARFDLPVVVNEAVRTYLERFQTRERRSFARHLARSLYYVPLIRPILLERGLPGDLAYLPLIESGFNPYAYSRSRAGGLWQFIPSTGKKYGLRIDDWVDERRDPVRATHAAARYFQDLYQRFGDWHLVLAAFNGGESRVEEGLRRTGARTFWELREAYALPWETREYVPRFLAALILAKDPEEYGFYLDPPPSEDLVPVAIQGPAALEAVARALDLAPRDLHRWNPQLRRDFIPPGKHPFLLRIPRNRLALFQARFPKIQKVERTTWIQQAQGRSRFYLRRHVVRPGETLWKIARHYGVKIAQIQAANRMGTSTLIRPGQVLWIPLGKYYPTQRTIRYRVRPGDSLWKIAAHHGVSLKTLMTWNHLDEDSILRPGDILSIPVRD